MTGGGYSSRQAAYDLQETARRNCAAKTWWSNPMAPGATTSVRGCARHHRPGRAARPGDRADPGRCPHSQAGARAEQLERCRPALRDLAPGHERAVGRLRHCRMMRHHIDNFLSVTVFQAPDVTVARPVICQRNTCFLRNGDVRSERLLSGSRCARQRMLACARGLQPSARPGEGAWGRAALSHAGLGSGISQNVFEDSGEAWEWGEQPLCRAIAVRLGGNAVSSAGTVALRCCAIGLIRPIGWWQRSGRRTDRQLSAASDGNLRFNSARRGFDCGFRAPG